MTSSNSESTFSARSVRSDSGVWTVLAPAAGDRPNSYSGGGIESEGSRRTFLAVQIDGVPRGEVELLAGQRSATIAVAEPMTIDVVVDGANGRELTVNAWIVQRSEDGAMSSRGVGSADVDAKGRAHLGPLEPRTYELTLQAGSRRGPRMELARVVVEAMSGKKEIRLQMPPIYSVDVDLGASHKNETIVFQLKREQGESRSHVMTMLTLDTEGRGELDPLIEGTYEFRLGSATRTFTVPGTTIVRE
jgi:hypothetical protein